MPAPGRAATSTPGRRSSSRPDLERITARDRVASADDLLDARHLGPEQVERYLRRHRLAPTRRFSQNHLVDGEVLDAIIEAARPDGRRILEIGPGIGILTGALLAAGAERLTAVEVDRRIAAHLRERFERQPRLTVVEQDVLDADVATLVEPPYDLVANLPYHITSPVLHQALGEDPRPERFVLMLQREVAERISAMPGQMSYLSVFVQYHAEVSILRVVPPSAFEPAPEVDSAIVVGEVRERRLHPDAEAGLWRLVQAAFRERRKMLHNVLVRQLPAVGWDRFAAALDAAGIDVDRRPQTLSVEEWMDFAARLGPLPA